MFLLVCMLLLFYVYVYLFCGLMFIRFECRSTDYMQFVTAMAPAIKQLQHVHTNGGTVVANVYFASSSTHAFTSATWNQVGGK